LAVISCILGVPCIFALPLPIVALLHPVLPFIFLIAALLAVLLGIISLAKIGLSAGKITGRGFAAIGITIPVLLFFLTMSLRVLARTRCVAYHNYCGTNLSGIGKAMLIYCNDYENEMPRAGGPTSTWGTTRNWRAQNRIDAYGLTDGAPGQATISASLYFLVKYAEITPKQFLCKGDSGVKEFKPSDYGAGGMDLIDLWDFGPNPAKHCSYSYHIPYGPYALTSSSDPGMAVAADRNPWIGPNRRPDKDWNKFDPVGDRKAVKYGNAIAHKTEGQYVLFMDCHVKFEKTSACGVNDDNIYTYWNDKDISRGARPILGSQPADPNDSLLVHDPPLKAGK